MSGALHSARHLRPRLRALQHQAPSEGLQEETPLNSLSWQRFQQQGGLAVREHSKG